MKIKYLPNKFFIKTLISIAVSIGLIGLPTMSASALSLSSGNYFASSSSQAACGALNSLDSGQGCGSKSGGTVNNLVTTIVNILSIVVGIVAVIVIIISGLRFITSGGDSQKVASAKTALIYALIGLFVVALAQFIVHFAVHTATSSVK